MNCFIKTTMITYDDDGKRLIKNNYFLFYLSIEKLSQINRKFTNRKQKSRLFFSDDRFSF